MSSDPLALGLAGSGAAKHKARRANRKARVGRPGWVTYAILGFVLVLSAYPLYYSFLLGSSDATTIARTPVPSLIPQGNFGTNVARVISADIHFWKAVANSAIIAVITSLSVVFFSTLAGYSFSKLRFRGRGPLLVFVVATMAVPTQLSIVPMFIAQGGHLKNDVPLLMDELRNAHPDVRFVLSPPVGEAEPIVQAMAGYALGLAGSF